MATEIKAILLSPSDQRNGGVCGLCSSCQVAPCANPFSAAQSRYSYGDELLGTRVACPPKRDCSSHYLQPFCYTRPQTTQLPASVRADSSLVRREIEICTARSDTVTRQSHKMLINVYWYWVYTTAKRVWVTSCRADTRERQR